MMSWWIMIIGTASVTLGVFGALENVCAPTSSVYWTRILDREQDLYGSHPYSVDHGILALGRLRNDHCRHSAYVAAVLDAIGVCNAVDIRAHCGAPCLLFPCFLFGVLRNS